MADSTVMKAGDTISGALATCVIKVPFNFQTGKPLGTTKHMYKFMMATKVEAKLDKTKVEVPILGKTGKGNKSVGWKGTGSATFHYSTSIFRKILEYYKDNGGDIYFDMVIENEDPSSKTGKQSVTLVDCNLDGGIVAKFDAGSEVLDEDLTFTFEDFRIDTPFTNLAGFKTTGQ